MFRCTLASGNLAAWRQRRSDLVKRYNTMPREDSRNEFAWACVLGPDETADFDMPIRLAEFAVQQAIARANGANMNPLVRANTLNTLGAALYRAGRLGAAIRTLEEGIRFRGGIELPQDVAFLAMAHRRLGRHDLALSARPSAKS